MRIIRLKLTQETKTILAALSKEHGLDDPGFVEDVFALMRLRGNGLPDTARIEKMADNVCAKAKKAGKRTFGVLGVRLIMSKRKMILAKLAKLPYFVALSRQKTDLTSGVARLLTTFRTMYRKVRESQCRACSLFANCDFGKQYGNAMRDITKVFDPDYKQKVHADCPVLPDISTLNQMVVAAQFMQNLSSKFSAKLSKVAGAKAPTNAPPVTTPTSEDSALDKLDPDEAEADYVPHMDSGGGKGDPYNNSHTGQHICSVTEAFVNSVSLAQLSIFELGRRFNIALGVAEDEELVNTPNISEDKTQNTITSLNDLTALVASQNALPDEVFDKRHVNKQLVKVQQQKKEEVTNVRYLLIDSTGSMGAQLGNAQNQMFSRGALATVFSLSITRKSEREKGLLFVRFFAGTPAPLKKAQSADEFVLVSDYIANNNYNGSSTDITAAVRAAIADINAAGKSQPLGNCEILLITDCDDSDVGKLQKSEFGGIAFNVLDVSGSGNAVNSHLKSISTKYFKGDETAPDVNQLCKLV